MALHELTHIHTHRAISLCVHVYRYKCVYTCRGTWMHRCTCMYMRMKAIDQPQGLFLSLHLLCFLRGFLASEHMRSSCFCPSRTRGTGICHQIFLKSKQASRQTNMAMKTQHRSSRCHQILYRQTFLPSHLHPHFFT